MGKYIQISLFTGKRSSRPDVFCEKGVIRNFVKFTGKHWWLLLWKTLVMASL